MKYKLPPLAVVALALLLGGCADGFPIHTTKPVEVRIADTAELTQLRAENEALRERVNLLERASPATSRAVPKPKPNPATERVSKWYPWYAKKANLSLSEFVTALKENDAGKVRVSWKHYRDQFAGMGLPVGDDAVSFEQFLRSDDVEIVACTPALLSQYKMGRTNADGTVFDYGYERSVCYSGEQFLRYKPTGQVFLSLGCGNALFPKQPVQPAKPTPGERINPTVICPPDEKDSCPKTEA
jgi:hypothetical protein